MSAPLSDAHGYELVRVATKWKLPVDLQKLIWADVTGRYHRRHGRWGQFGLPVIEKAHVVIQTAARRMLGLIKARFGRGTTGWRWSEFVGRRLDYARSVRLPKDMRRYYNHAYKTRPTTKVCIPPRVHAGTGTHHISPQSQAGQPPLSTLRAPLQALMSMLPSSLQRPCRPQRRSAAAPQRRSAKVEMQR